MDIKGNSLYAQMQSMQFEAMGSRMPSVENNITPTNPSTSDFGNMLKQAVNAVNDAQHEAKDKRNAFEMGDRNVTLADTMITAAKSGIAFDATVQVRNKFVEAYKEIMAMPV